MYYKLACKHLIDPPVAQLHTERPQSHQQHLDHLTHCSDAAALVVHTQHECEYMSTLMCLARVVTCKNDTPGKLGYVLTCSLPSILCLR